MAEYKLYLKPIISKGAAATEFHLEECPTSKIFTPKKSAVPCVDYRYKAQIAGWDEGDEIDKLEFYLSGIQIETDKPDRNGNFTFTDRGRIFYRTTRLFQISLEITFKGEKSVILYSKWCPVKIRNDRTTDSLMRMAEYVCDRGESLYPWGKRLFLNEKRLDSAVKWGLKREGAQEPGTQLQILEKIVQVYSTNLGYFRMSAKSRLRTVDHVDSFEKSKAISSRTLSYTAQHMEYLMPSPAGIRWGKQNFIPLKTLVNQNSVDCDIYENQVVVGFLKYLDKAIGDQTAGISQKTKSPAEERVESEYVFFDDIALLPWLDRLKMIKDQLLRLQEKIKLLYVQYSEALPVSELIISKPPRPSAILMSVPPYRLIYEQIDQWFHYGIYDYHQDDVIVPMLISDRLYEYYVLLKLIHYIEKSGYSILDEGDKRYFQYTEDDSEESKRSKEVQMANTFVFKKPDASTEITLYYQPYIYGARKVEVEDGKMKYTKREDAEEKRPPNFLCKSSDSYKKFSGLGENGLELLRTLSLPFNNITDETLEDNPKKRKKGLAEDNIDRSDFYTPDYVIKIHRKDHDHYIILDAKFSTRSIARKYRVRELLYKYLISISTRRAEDQLAGLILINGKIDENETQDEIENVFDLEEHEVHPDVKEITPYAKILSITEIHRDMAANAEQHGKLMEGLFGFGSKNLYS